MRTVGDAISILEQFPRNQELEIGIATEDDPQLITCLPIGEILISDGQVVIVDEETAQLIKSLIAGKLNIRAKPKGKASEKEKTVDAELTAGTPLAEEGATAEEATGQADPEEGDASSGPDELI